MENKTENQKNQCNANIRWCEEGCTDAEKRVRLTINPDGWMYYCKKIKRLLAFENLLKEVGCGSFTMEVSKTGGASGCSEPVVVQPTNQQPVPTETTTGIEKTPIQQPITECPASQPHITPPTVIVSPTPPVSGNPPQQPAQPDLPTKGAGASDTAVSGTEPVKKKRGRPPKQKPVEFQVVKQVSGSESINSQKANDNAKEN